MLKKLLIIMFIIIHGTVFAGIGVDPVILEVVASKDIPTAGIFKVSNTGANPVEIRVSPEKLQGKDIDVTSWVTLLPASFSLLQNEEKEVKYKISPPQDSIGELRCMVFFVADETGENRSNVGIRFGVPIYAIVGGTEILEAGISNVNIKYNNNVLSGTIYVNNKGNIHIRPDIAIDVLDSRDKPVNTLNLQHGQPAQAGQNRPFEFEQYIVLNEGRYKAVVKVDYGKMYKMDDKIAEGKASFVVRKEDEPR